MNFHVDVESQSITASTGKMTIGGGNAVAIISNSVDDLVITFYKNGSPVGTLTNVGQGLIIGHKQFGVDAEVQAFDRAEIKVGTTQTVKLAYGFGDVFYNVIGGSISATISKGSTFAGSVVPIGTTSTALLAAAARKAVTFHNEDTTNPVYIQGGASATTAGFKLGPGESITLTESPSGQFSAIATGASVNVGVATES